MEAWVGIGRTIFLLTMPAILWKVASGNKDRVACHFLELHAIASRPPVKAALRLALLGLDRAQP
jgi:hypothetical protein